MEFREVVRRRRMVRSYEDRPIAPDVLDRVLRAGMHAPSAGFTQGVELLVLEGREQTDVFWTTTLDPTWRARRARQAGLERAPVIVLPMAHRRAYLDRYSEPDKAGLGMDREGGWPVPYWDVDAGFAAMLVLLAAVDEGLGALFFGIFRGERELLETLGVPSGYRPVGAITLGWPAVGDVPSPSLARGHRPFEEQVHRGRW